MTLNRQDPEPISGSKDPSFFTATSTPKISDEDLLKYHDPASNSQVNPPSIPWPGSTFMIRSAFSGHVITLQGGQVILAQPDSVGNSRWKCVENHGWLGFRDPGSGRFLGHDRKGKLQCVAERHYGWEHFCVRHRPEGGYVLFMRHWDELWHVRLLEEQGVQKLTKIGDGEGVVWEFVKV